MSIEKDRLLSLIEFAQQSARLRAKPVSSVAQHNQFALYEHQLQSLPGIHLNENGSESGDEIWLVVERMHERQAPEADNAVLRPWIQMAQTPMEEPRLLEVTDGTSLISAGTHRPAQEPISRTENEDKPGIGPKDTVLLSDYARSAEVRALFGAYVQGRWRPWAEEEKLRRRTIRLYAQLFTLKQQLEGGIVEAQLEVVWGVGLGIWNCQGTAVSYPLVAQLAEILLNPVTAEIEIRPRDMDARLELDWYASVDNPGVAGLEKAAKEFFGQENGQEKKTFSPFDRGTFEPLLRSAVSHLDANGIYWPNETKAEDRTPPRADDKLRVTDTWVLFARPRTQSIFLQDLEKLKKAVGDVHDEEEFPPAVEAIVTDPSPENPVVELPMFRGVSASYHGDAGAVSGHKKIRDLYFPKPFNDEQVRIIQLLDVSDGVVVQGPPGTGKTHTIANVICHYLAEGKRVLVTSMKDPALAVLQEQLPQEIRPLAISLLSSEQAGLKQFEHAIHKIASEVQSIDRGGTARAIAHLEESIDALHGRLAAIDRKIGEWASHNLTKISLDSEEIDPQDAAREVAGNDGQFEWLPDRLGIAPEYAPQFTDAEILALREARKILGRDIDYLGASLPQLVAFPDSLAILEVHRDLSRFEKLKQELELGEVPPLIDSSEPTLTAAGELHGKVAELHVIRGEVHRGGNAWAVTLRGRLYGDGNGNGNEMLVLLEALGAELEKAATWRKKFIERPVHAAPDSEIDKELVEAITNLSESRRPFGLIGLFGKSEQKSRLDSIRVLGRTPDDSDTWKHVGEYLAMLRHLRALAIRWDALARELELPLLQRGRPEDCLTAAAHYAFYLKVKLLVHVEKDVCARASRLFPRWPGLRELSESAERLIELDKALHHHITRNRLAKVWITKERFQKVLEGKSGRVIEDIRRFLAQSLGNPAVPDAEMQAAWSALMAELSRIHGLGTHLSTVGAICGKIDMSGAPKYAAALRTPLESVVDSLLPDNWRQAWRLRRLATHLESIDAREELKTLTKARRDVENDLSRAYRDVVVKRTWLKLAENASPSIRAALQTYLAAIQKIGKGTGKRAVRYRQDARLAASRANPAVPCWIMPHYRVSESLPPDLGCFDLVVIDEASQSDLNALPSLLRAEKVLIVGDDKQVSPEGVGLEEEKVRSLMTRFLGNQVETYRPQMSPERSIYDLFKVVFATSAVMLKEHFRCVAPIIEYSKREFYNHELRPLRLPKTSERLDPPLIDVVVEDGFRKGDVNLPEARFIIGEIKQIVADPGMAGRSIGVVSLLADKQALAIWDRLTDEIGPETMQRHQIACGDARTFQGKERDIMFLSMVSAPNEIGAPLSRDTFAQRFNVAASRARDRMYLVRSVELENLSAADRLRRGLISHFATPFAQDEIRVEDLRKLCESPFERELYDLLVERGYWVTPQVCVGQYRIDMVVEGHNDVRQAIECDGDKYHGAEKWADDMQRQRNLERAGWVFWRCFASAFFRRRNDVLGDLLKTLADRGIEPIGGEKAPKSVHAEHRVVRSSPDELSKDENRETQDFPEPATPPAPKSPPITENVGPPDAYEVAGAVPYVKPVGHEHRQNSQLNDPGRQLDETPGTSAHQSARSTQLPGSMFVPYVEYRGPAGGDPRGSSLGIVADGLCRIIEVEGPMIAKRAYDIYLRGCGIKRMGHELRSTMNKALSSAIGQGKIVSENETGTRGLIFSTVRIKGAPPVKIRTRGPRLFNEIPPDELRAVGQYTSEKLHFTVGTDEHLRSVLDHFELRRLTTQVGTTILEILEKKTTPATGLFEDEDSAR